ncbi:DUF4202 domain-containing protein [Teredinibacter waterburyi]|jgi:hypothetical protein|uniref:DUF4202 domain-containing protein n=1 Tax=Teredinibacter waterburyi TaxID=1500538 RepID=UPI00165FBFB1|nr:DUF4202 domain-containing protein [Teredinibacter waterburyi]
MSDKLTEVLDAIDNCNRADPNQEFDLISGTMHPKELLYGQRMSQELALFLPNASEHLQIAARGQHIERWTSARSDYPEGRAGYKKWRSQLGLFHASRVGSLMEAIGYENSDIERVKFLLQKRQLRRDEETQALENVICLVFLRYYLDAFAAKHDEPKLIDIIQKTWGKMSEAGHSAALALPLSSDMQSLVGKALS